jgi:hypothetical protein
MIGQVSAQRPAVDEGEVELDQAVVPRLIDSPKADIQAAA